MIKKRKIILVILAVVVLLLGIIAYKQRNNVLALKYMFTMDSEQLKQALDENENNLFEALGQEKSFEVTLTEDQKNDVISGELDAEEIAKQVLDNQEIEKNDSTQNEQTTNDSETDELIRVKVAKLYVLKASYIGQLEGLVQQAKNEYVNLPEDQRTNANKQKIAKSKISIAGQLESACDAQVSAIVEEVRTLLGEANRDKSIADEIMNTYLKEKSLKKAYYMEQIG